MRSCILAPWRFELSRRPPRTTTRSNAFCGFAIRTNRARSGWPKWTSELSLMSFRTMSLGKQFHAFSKDCRRNSGRTLAHCQFWTCTWTPTRSTRVGAIRHSSRRENNNVKGTVSMSLGRTPTCVGSVLTLSVRALGFPREELLSCFLANAILDQADWAIEDASKAAHGHADEALYLRYCDDIICLACARDQCERMLTGICVVPRRFEAACTRNAELRPAL